MNRKAIGYQTLIFAVQWGLMIAGFAILKMLAQVTILEPQLAFGQYFDGAIKASVAFGLSAVWLLFWDRQVRFLFYRKLNRA